MVVNRCQALSTLAFLLVLSAGVGAQQDLCPTDDAKSLPGHCGCGVPDIDTDGDGFYDCVDPCPQRTWVAEGSVHDTRHPP